MTEESKQQKDKVISAFLRLLPEKELAQQLITMHLEFIRFKKQGIDTEVYEEKIEEYEEKSLAIKKQLRSKLSPSIVKDTMNKIQAILTDCEKLVLDELELETKLTVKSQLITEHYQSSLQITDNPEESNKRKRIVSQEEEVQEQQMVQFKRVRSNSLIFEIEKARLEGKAEAYKEVAISPRTTVYDNRRNYDSTHHYEHHQSQFYQDQRSHEEVPPKNN